MVQENAQKQSGAQGGNGAQAADPAKAPNPLSGKELPEQQAMVTPAENKAGAKDGEPAGEKKAEKLPALGAYAYSAEELEAMLDATCGADRASEKWKSTAQQWIAHGMEKNRAHVKQQMELGNVAALDVAAKFEGDVAGRIAEPAAAAFALAKPRAEWLGEVVAAYLSKTQMSSAELAEDKGPTGSDDDKSDALTKAYILKLETLQAQCQAAFPADCRAVVKELTLRRELFKQMADNHNKSNEESGISSAKGSVADKAKGVTSCNAYNGQLLQKAFGEADKQVGEGGVSIKETKPVTWDNVKKVQGRGPLQQQYGFYDNLGKAAKDIGAWIEGGPGVVPKAGDIYILETGSSISHIGFFKFAEAVPDARYEIWHTMDGGQMAGKPMTDPNFAGAVKTVQDGSLNNIKRLYTKAVNTVEIPPAAKLAELRGATPSDDDKQGGAPKVNQDGKLRTVAGFIDVGKLIAADKVQEDPTKPKK